MATIGKESRGNESTFVSTMSEMVRDGFKHFMSEGFVYFYSSFLDKLALSYYCIHFYAIVHA